MADWDADSQRLSENLQRILHDLERGAYYRAPPEIEWARDWHRSMMVGLDIPEQRYVGRFRGEEGMEGVEVAIGPYPSVVSSEVATALESFNRRLAGTVAYLDNRVSLEAGPWADELRSILILCAWVHGEWVRIHPFANGNGRTARLWVNMIALRYGLPPFVRPRPRPGGDYGAAAAAAMQGNWSAGIEVFRRMLIDWLASH